MAGHQTGAVSSNSAGFIASLPARGLQDAADFWPSRFAVTNETRIEVRMIPPTVASETVVEISTGR
jgi:hypothetical protein